jgi:hypothetical protein
MIQLSVCDGGLGSTTDRSVSGIFGGQSVTGTGFSASTEVFPCHYHSTSIPYSDFVFVLLTLYSLCSWQHHSVTLKQQCLSVCHLVMKKRDGLCNTDFKFILLVAQEGFQAVNWRAYLHILSLK